MSEMNRPRKIVVLGGGCAGLLAAIAIKKHLPEDELIVVRSLKMGVIGVGEGTIHSVVGFLHNFLGIDEARFHREVRPTIKLGIRYNWGPREKFYYTFAPQFSPPVKNTNVSRGYFYDDSCEFADPASALMNAGKVCFRTPNGQPRLPVAFAYHLENKAFVSFLELLSDELKIEKIDAIVEGTEFENEICHSIQLDNGETISGDLFIDCSGFGRKLIGQAPNSEFVSFANSLFCDSAIFGGWERQDGEVIFPYTTVDTMESGWSWQIEHDQFVNRGYVYDSDFLDETAAVEEFKKANPNIESTRSVKFQTGAQKESWIGNVVAVGNAAGFVEPLEATAVGVICDTIVRLTRVLKRTGRQPGPAVRESFNRVQFQNWEIIRDFLALHYRFNTRLKTPFWDKARAETPLGNVQKWVDLYQETGPDFQMVSEEFSRDFFGIEGYLSMLVGQQIPYENHQSISPLDKNHWRNWKNYLKDLVVDAMDMKEYLATMRTTQSDPGSFRYDSGGTGQLQWH